MGLGDRHAHSYQRHPHRSTPPARRGVLPGAGGWPARASDGGGARLGPGGSADFDPERNRLQWGRDRAAFARPEYDAWWRQWEEEGWVSLGRTANFDWMHVQAARRA